MAYVSQDLKAKLAPTIKAVCKKYGIKATLAVRHHSTLVLNIKEGNIDFLGSFNKTCRKQPRYNEREFVPAKESIDVNTYWYHEHFDGVALDFLKEVICALRGPDFYDYTDIQVDYFNCSHYIDVNIGRWDQPYILKQ